MTAQDVWEDLVHLRRGDLVIGISFPRCIDAAVRAIAEARRQGRRIVVLTDSVPSPLNRYADVVLTARHANETHANSFVAPLSLINALLAAISLGDKPRATHVLHRLEAVWERCGLYYRPSDAPNETGVNNGAGRNSPSTRRRPQRR